MIRRPINLGQASTTIGWRTPPYLPKAPQASAGAEAQAVQAPSAAAALGLATGAAQTPTVESGHWLEALAAALEGGIRGRAAYHEQARTEWREEDALRREQKQADRANQGWAAALDAYDANSADPAAQNDAMVRALQGYNPEAAFELATRQRAPVDQWSDPYELGDAQVQRNRRTNQIRPIVPRPPQSQGNGLSDEWESF